MITRDKFTKKILEFDLVDPTSASPTILDLINSIASRCGVNSKNDKFKDIINTSTNYIFVIVDGMGMNSKFLWPSDGFLNSNYKGTIYSLFPSTTSSVLTSITTGKSPAEHAIPGWWTYLDKYKTTVVALPFKERFSQRPLKEFKITAKDLYIEKSMFSDFTHQATFYVPKELNGSVYSNYFSDMKKSYGFNNIANGVDQIIEHQKKNSSPSFSYFYLPEVDSLFHKNGITHSSIPPLFIEIDKQLERLFNCSKLDTTIIVTADHGMIDIPTQNNIIINDNSEIMEHLAIPPTGESRIVLFHTKKGSEKAFKNLFDKKYAEKFLLLSIKEVQELRLFGNAKMNDCMVNRLGAFVAIPYKTSTMKYFSSKQKVEFSTAMRVLVDLKWKFH